MSTESRTISRKFDAMLRMIAEDLCNHRDCEVGLLEHRHELRAESGFVIESLNSHVIACNPDYRVEAIEPGRATDLWNNGVPFAIINSKTGEERWMQLGGGDPGVATCGRATEEQIRKHNKSMEEWERQKQQSQAARAEFIQFLTALSGKVRAVAGKRTLTSEQRSDFEYHLRSLPAGEPIPEYSLNSALEYICRACRAIGITLEQLGDR